ncbi:hypothetical protein [Leptospira licerasiae]|uniref:hypothetical protein n=1 Tax=Leptospira licerasiae TaxID=447106 RepID=UPI0010834B96|nr:hypothetical protein [Leptospira licerasiae]TGM85590.1 hypothetical protein EHR05_18735 [Leptospira licerasiae]
MESILREIFGNLSSMIRFSLPGFVAIGLGYGAIPDVMVDFLKDFQTKLAVGLIVGATAHTIHRNAWFVIVESWLFITDWTAVSNYGHKRCEIAKGWSDFALIRYTERFAKSNLSGYLGHRWSLAHSGAVIGELTILSAILATCGSYIFENFGITLSIGIVIFVISLCNIFILYRVEKHILIPKFDFEKLN